MLSLFVSPLYGLVFSLLDRLRHQCVPTRPTAGTSQAGRAEGGTRTESRRYDGEGSNAVGGG